MPFNPINIGEIVCQRELVIFVLAVILPNEARRLIWVSYPVVACAASIQHGGMAKPSPTHAGDPALVAIGKAIRELRTELGLSQEILAHEAGVDRSYMGGIERGEHNLTIISLLRICRSLHVSVGELLQRATV